MAFQIRVINSDQDDLQQVLGFYDIFKESLNIILTWPKIFIQITLAFVLPHSCLYLAHHWIFKSAIHKIRQSFSTLATKEVGPESATYWLIMVTYLVSSLILSLLTTSTVIYTVACICSGKEITFRKVMNAIPKVWKRLMITFISTFAYVAVLTAFMTFMFVSKPHGEVGILVRLIMKWIIVILFMIGIFYITMIWLLANAVSVMDNNYGFQALKKSKELIKGNMSTAFVILLTINIISIPKVLLIQKLVGVGITGRVCLGIPIVVLWTLFTLFSIVVETIFYFVCKSYHHEFVDNSILSDHLDMYIREYVPLKSEDAIQLENLHV